MYCLLYIIVWLVIRGRDRWPFGGGGDIFFLGGRGERRGEGKGGGVRKGGPWESEEVQEGRGERGEVEFKRKGRGSGSE